MKAVVLDCKGYDLQLKDVVKPVPFENEVLVELYAAALNHHELWSLQEKKISSDTEIILGSDGAGMVVEVGDNVDRNLIGSSVIINPGIHWGPDANVQGPNFEILGFPTNGTFAEFIKIPVEYIFPKPSSLTYEEAAALPLAGLTAFRALFTKGQLKKGDKVLVTGIGGGVALFAMQFASTFGAEVFVTSGDNNKIHMATSRGAISGANYKKSGWANELKQQAGGFDVIIDSAAGQNFSELIELTNPGGRIVLYGRTAGTIEKISPKTLFWRQISILGSSMGTNKEFAQMIKYVEEHRLKPFIDEIISLENINYGFEKMTSRKHMGKIILKIQ